MGILDQFLNMQTAPAGMLTPDDQTAIRNRGLLGMAMGLLNASGPSTTPISTGQALGQGLTGMMGAQDSAMENAIRMSTLKRQIDGQQAEAKYKAADLAKSFTPESMQEYLSTGDPTRLRKVEEPYTLTPGSRRMDANNNVLAEAPLGPKVEILADGTVVDKSKLQPGQRLNVGLSPAQQIELGQQGQQQRQFGINTELKLRDDYRNDSKTYGEIKRQADLINKSLDDPSAAGTLAAATSFMKLLDPGSVVRESELGMAMASTGSVDRLFNYFNVIENGKVLTSEQKTDFKRLTEQYVKAAEEAQRNVNKRYSETADAYGLNPKNIVMYDLPDSSVSNLPPPPPLQQSGIGSDIPLPNGITAKRIK